jgi:hypothetical protein
MSPRTLQQLRARATAIRDQWEAMLRVEPVNGPLANPDTLLHLIPSTLDEIFTALAKHPRATGALESPKVHLPACECGNNPYLAYFVAGEQALMEALVLVHSQLPPPERQPGDVRALQFVVRKLALAEIDTWCSICAHRGATPKCRHALAVG